MAADGLDLIFLVKSDSIVSRPYTSPDCVDFCRQYQAANKSENSN